MCIENNNEIPRQESLQIDNEALNKFLEAKRQFQPFKQIDTIPDDNMDMSKSELPVFTEEENSDRVMKAMERLYGEDNVIHEVLNNKIDIKATGSNKTTKRKTKRK